jgi:hypothetical protein
MKIHKLVKVKNRIPVVEKQPRKVMCSVAHLCGKPCSCGKEHIRSEHCKKKCGRIFTARCETVVREGF